LARSVYLSFGDLDVQPSDNYFDLLPGEPRTITLKAPAAASSDQLRSAMQIVSLTDAFPAAPTMH
jgi:beta-mannosidase